MPRIKVFGTKFFAEIPAEFQDIFLWESEDFIQIKCIQDPRIAQQLQQLGNQKINAIITSSNTLSCISKIINIQSLDWNYYLINGKTESLAKELFPKINIVASAKNATTLLQFLPINNQVKTYIFCGDQSLDIIPNFLNQENVVFEKIVVYENQSQPKEIKKDYEAYLFFSPSGVNSFFEKNLLPKNSITIAIGGTTAKALLTFAPNQKILIADEPNLGSMLGKLKEYYAEE